ncbi:GNAT family N-acetyltransferase [Streptomyces iconiensis]|uniref:GNAT family N-acetyltransferase n=1 Tax=Streptomyces iconiensis TaxID=1384038 RepID=A0ABT6ZQB4_9ACTN|nr:GNAT family N-acetyltransferase [Streptomyces iconiensis]MDJ1131236.1 GNAT family N-acetyltransferase [Streptomyces iconiensis]
MKIDRATEADTEVISQLLGQIEAYYGGDYAPADAEQVRAALFSDRPAATVLLARGDDGTVLGMASYTRLWPAAGADTSLYLKELYVREGARRRGVAAAFMERLKEEAAAAGCSRIEWTADDDNPSALRFYEALGVQRHQGKVFYRAGV